MAACSIQGLNEDIVPPGSRVVRKFAGLHGKCGSKTHLEVAGLPDPLH